MVNAWNAGRTTPYRKGNNWRGSLVGSPPCHEPLVSSTTSSNDITDGILGNRSLISRCESASPQTKRKTGKGAGGTGEELRDYPSLQIVEKFEPLQVGEGGVVQNGSRRAITWKCQGFQVVDDHLRRSPSVFFLSISEPDREVLELRTSVQDMQHLGHSQIFKLQGVQRRIYTGRQDNGRQETEFVEDGRCAQKCGGVRGCLCTIAFKGKMLKEREGAGSMAQTLKVASL
ncbi:hypothetical protein B0H16DRAFT_1452161 [Mycena metata]|uniref:Uncharacterized protein n=1 Tax=Mycena metata TaxID=1033252 RepID=A0AAD7NQH7_9AGAR|nr:hypothetical protein B0H16DRAFT_1452161 [Mycena metata]